MYAQNSQPGGMSGAVSSVSNASGIAAAILLTPFIFDWSRARLFRYFAKTIGREFAPWMTWISGAVEAYAIYALVTFLVTLLLTWLLMIFASRHV
jgi:hypothetical protein